MNGDSLLDDEGSKRQKTESPNTQVEDLDQLKKCIEFSDLTGDSLLHDEGSKRQKTESPNTQVEALDQLKKCIEFPDLYRYYNSNSVNSSFPLYSLVRRKQSENGVLFGFVSEVKSRKLNIMWSNGEQSETTCSNLYAVCLK